MNEQFPRKSDVTRWSGQTSNLDGVASNPGWVRLPYSSAPLPADRLYAPGQDMWVSLHADGTARLGATHLVAAHGEFMIFTPRPAGTRVELDRSMGVMETTKTAMAIHAPLTLRILEVNPSVEGSLSLLHTDPYGEGWMFRVQPLDLATEQAALLDATAYARWLAPRAAERFAPPSAAGNPDDELRVDANRGY